ncbi:aspartate carbamoyltransferase catalytic subunit [Prochlorococcus marinus]|uniref:Aspartate carbamoyltransferase n=1 Tax=Prochlorococcus marinus XMU1408 TaxID=2213228 RepID=A0A318R3B0_PROMR|nr:aspartate carbamoyltransferase catalytic subunit [Prochlorococcus marinus]MBW3041293.1 aspartate carbamoyltransferase [Prochlorococcus marinus str. XMU1408]PYE02468.1 aspartate carbamoyltransferase [Prochlorococcus marinus XMU1408]
MNNWKHNHILDLSTFSLDDYQTVLELTTRFKDVHKSSSRKLPALQGRLITNLFFEPSTRTRTSFELAAKRLSADVQNFSVSASSLSKGETPLDTILTYISMGADILIIRHESTNVPADLANYVDKNNINTSILNAGDGYHSHPSQGLLDLYTLATFFNPSEPSTNSLINKRITIVGDILHSRVARSNLWSLTACGADVTLCGPSSLLPNEFIDFVLNPPPGQKIDPINKRGSISIERSLKHALKNADAVMTLRLQKERMKQNMLTDLETYHETYGITHQSLKWCEKKVPVLHPGPVNRGIEISSQLVEDNSINLISKQVENGIPTRMALLYLLGLNKNN